MKECDRFSLVTYDTNVELVFGLMKMEKDSKDRAKSFVESIHDGSSTNLCGGLLKGWSARTDILHTDTLLPKIYIIKLFGGGRVYFL